MDRNMFDISEFYKDNMHSKPNCGCEDTTDNSCINPLTMVFINMQPLEHVYPTEEAFCNGTLFPNLNKPFYGGMKR